MKKQRIVLHLGSNMGHRLNFLNNALLALQNTFGTPLKTSAIYETQAWGNTEQSDFLNMAATFNVQCSPSEILKKIKEIETITGRQKRAHWHQREIDIDILFYGNEIINQSGLEIPHAQIANRKFVLVPLNEICPDFIHPVLKLPISEILKNCPDILTVEKWNP